VLTSLNLVSGVDHSYTNSSGTLIRLTLKPGADPEKVVSEARRVLERVVEDRTVYPVPPGEVPEALSGEWQDRDGAVERVPADAPAPDAPPSGGYGWLALLLALAVVFAALWMAWRALTKPLEDYKVDW
jgi:hypothetical protein